MWLQSLCRPSLPLAPSPSSWVFALTSLLLIFCSSHSGFECCLSQQSLPLTWSGSNHSHVSESHSSHVSWNDGVTGELVHVCCVPHSAGHCTVVARMSLGVGRWGWYWQRSHQRMADCRLHKVKGWEDAPSSVSTRAPAQISLWHSSHCVRVINWSFPIYLAGCSWRAASVISLVSPAQTLSDEREWAHVKLCQWAARASLSNPVDYDDCHRHLLLCISAPTSCSLGTKHRACCRIFSLWHLRNNYGISLNRNFPIIYRSTIFPSVFINIFKHSYPGQLF